MKLFHNVYHRHYHKLSNSFLFVGRTLLRNKTDRQDTAQTITILPSVPVNICLLIG
jgi:hypothetical protein